MKLYVRILFAVLCALLLAGMPLFLSSPSLLREAETEIVYSEDEEEDSLDFGRLFFSSALADEADEDLVLTEDIDPEELMNPHMLSIPEAWELPFDFSVPPMPDPDRFTEDGYEDQSIRVRVETKNMLDSVVHAAYVEIASPTQLRTAVPKRDAYVIDVANANNAVIAMNGDFMRKDDNNKFFEIRMTKTQKVGKKLPQSFDTLVIDKNGDFHVFVLSDGLKEYKAEHMDDIVNAFLFGPALVKDGEIVCPEGRKYILYASEHYQPRSAIGQTGPLSYVMVVVESRGSSNSKGVTHAGLAEIMLELGCVQAYNLDGGNSAQLYMQGPDPDLPKFDFKGDQNGTDNFRPQSDIIYFATAVPLEERQ